MIAACLLIEAILAATQRQDKRIRANQLNLSGETFSRILRRLIEAGLIVAEDGPTLKIISRKGLQQVCDGLFPNL